jgi:hypothetical protein
MPMSSIDPSSTVVFLGPSLPLADAEAVLRADYRPPAGMGDIYELLGSGVETIVLIDGVFHTAPAIWQREIVAAIDEGLTVFGGVGMGALRAQELSACGMIGYGTINDWYRDRVIDGDDEVALRYEAEGTEYRALSEPLVNLRFALAEATRVGLIDSGEEAALARLAKGTSYPLRSRQLIVDSELVRGWSKAKAATLDAVLQRAASLTRRDSIALLEHVRGHGQRQPAPVRASSEPAPRDLFEQQRMNHRMFHRLGRSHSGTRLLQRIREDRVVDDLRRPLALRWFLLDWARGRNLTCPADEVERLRRALGERAGRSASSLTEREYEAAVREIALFEWLVRRGCAAFGVSFAWSGRETSHREDGLSPLVGSASVVGFLVEWAREHGVSGERATSSDGMPPDFEAAQALATWMVERGPTFFGFAWRFDIAALREVQIRGQLDALLEGVAS